MLWRGPSRRDTRLDETTPGGAQASGTRVGVVISTLGRIHALDRLLADLAAQTVRPVAVAVCDQSEFSVSDAPGDPHRVADVCSKYRADLDIHLVSTQRGVSRGRNAGVAALHGVADYFLFPNDTSRVPPEFIATFAPQAGAEVVVAQYQDASGVRREHDSGLVAIDKRNVWLVMEAGMLVRSDALERVGGFSEDLGSGAESPWQSGEGTDLLLRLGNSGARIQFDNRLIMSGVPESSGLDATARHRKLRAYGRGYGHILREWNYGPMRSWVSVLGGLTLGIRQPRRFTLGDGLHVGLGRAEGIMNRLLGSELRMTAVDR